MKYRIIYATLVNMKECERLPKKELRRIDNAIQEKLMNDPVHFGKPLRRSMKGHRSLRVGDYRVIFRIDGDLVKIFAIGHRSTVYEDYED